MANSAASSNKIPETATTAIYVLRFAAALSSQGLTLQSNATAIDLFQPVAGFENALRESARSKSLLPRTPDTPGGSAGRLVPLALARVAPLGLPAKIVSLPEVYLGDSEERILDTWSMAFGYSRQFLIATPSSSSSLSTDQCDFPSSSSLAWITLNDASEPMLYPRRLILVDQSSIRTKASELSLSPALLAAAESTAVDVLGQGQPDLAVFPSDSISESTEPKPGLSARHSEVSEEREEGEDFEEGEEGEEGEYNEEGEISDPSESIPAVPPPPPRIVTGDLELDAVVGHLRTTGVSSPMLEQSLASIRESMYQFQTELRAEQEAEEKEARKREQLANSSVKREFPGLDTTMANGSKSTSANAKSTASGGGGTKKRQRSNTRDEAPPNKSRKKSVSSTSAPSAAKPVKANNSASTAATVPPPLLAAAGDLASPFGHDSLVNSIGPLSSSSALGGGNNAENPVTDIDMLFGEAGIDEEAANLAVGAVDMSAEGGMVVGAPADMSEGFGQIGGDDMGLGMGLGMGDNLDVDMGGFTTSLFGVTDDDFDFFDSVPAAAAAAAAASAATAASNQQQQQQLGPSKAEFSMILPHTMPFNAMN
ncbi:hypothetical protein GGI00_002673, partial [Coemansia sp. RSA 2681]